MSLMFIFAPNYLFTEVQQNFFPQLLLLRSSRKDERDV